MGKVVGVVLTIAVLLLMVVYITPAGRGAINQYFFKVQKVDDATNYETIKKVED